MQRIRGKIGEYRSGKYTIDVVQLPSDQKYSQETLQQIEKYLKSKSNDKVTLIYLEGSNKAIFSSSEIVDHSLESAIVPASLTMEHFTI